jgi:hypothetical protein
MSNTIWDPFFWSDWQSDQELKLCPLFAQAIWMRCLCVAAQSKRRGYVLIKGKKPANEDLARLFGCTVDEVVDGLEEIKNNEVCGETSDGILFSRRMVREAKRKAASRKGGKIGGRTTYGNRKGIFATQDDTQDDTQSETQDPPLNTAHNTHGARARVSTSTSTSISKETETLFDQFWNLYPKKVGKPSARKAYERALRRDEPETISAGATAYATARRGEPVRYTKNPATWLNDDGWNDETIADKTPSSSPQNSGEQSNFASARNTQMRARVRSFLETKSWMESLGPKPGEKGCIVPPHILEEFGIRGPA